MLVRIQILFLFCIGTQFNPTKAAHKPAARVFDSSEYEDLDPTERQLLNQLTGQDMGPAEFNLFQLDRVLPSLELSKMSRNGISLLRKLFFIEPYFSRHMRPDPALLFRLESFGDGEYRPAGVYGVNLDYLKALFANELHSFEESLKAFAPRLQKVKGKIKFTDWFYLFVQVFDLTDGVHLKAIIEEARRRDLKFAFSPQKFSTVLRTTKVSTDGQMAAAKDMLEWQLDDENNPVSRVSLVQKYEQYFPGVALLLQNSVRVKLYDNFVAKATASPMQKSLTEQLNWLGSTLFATDRGNNSFFEMKLKKDLEDIIALQWRAFKSNPAGLIKDTLGLKKDLQYLVFSTASEDDPGFKEAVTVFSSKYPELLNPAKVGVLWDRVENTSVAILVLNSFFQAHPSSMPVDLPADSLDILQMKVELSQDIIDLLKKKSNNYTNLYLAAFALQKMVPLPLFRHVSISPEAMEQRQFRTRFFDALLKIKDAVVSIHHMSHQAGLQAVYKVLDHLQKEGLHLDNIAFFEGVSDSFRLDQFLEVVQSYGMGGKVVITAEQMSELEVRWGDISPLYTLLINTHGQTKNSSNVHEVLSILEGIFKNEFERMKFDERKEQINYLDEQQQLAWKSSYSSADVFSKTKRLEEADLQVFNYAEALLSQKKEFWDAMIEVSQKNSQWDLLISEEEKKQLSRFVEERVTRMSPIEAIEQIVSEFELGHESEVLYLLVQAFDVECSNQSLKNILKLLSSFSKRNLWESVAESSKMPSLVEKMKSGLKQFDKKAKSPAEGILLTLNNWDARSMITIGDFVDVYSCMNYKTGGSNVRFIPANVLDAHTQALFSFYLQPGDFTSHDQFDAVANGLVSGDIDSSSIHYNGNTGVISFQNADHTYKTVPKYHGISRRIFRLGFDDRKAPGIVAVDKNYQQVPGLLTSALKQQEIEVLGKIREELGATTKRRITIAASKNPAGAYVDGIKSTTDKFTATPNYF